MAYDRRHVYLTFGGPLAGTEQWTTGVRWGHPENGTGDHNVTQTEWNVLVGGTQLNTIWTALVTWFQSGASGAAIGALAQLSWAKLAYVDLDGTYLADPLTKSATAVSPPQTTTMPPQVAYVVSLRSGSTIGRANYGRMYIPTPSWLPGQNAGVATAAEVTNARTAMKTLLTSSRTALQTAIPGCQPLLMSKLGLGWTRPVASLGVGVVLDTQRRRRSKLNEAMTLTAL